MSKVIGLTVNKTGDASQIRTNTYRVFDSSWTKIIGTKDLIQGDIIIRYVPN